MVVKESFADILKKVELRKSRKIESKIPEWTAEGICIPDSLAFEQCSSSATAAWKGRFAHGRVADLTGGLGVDSYAFSKVAQRVWYNERNAALAEAAAKNFSLLGADNIEVHCHDIRAELTEWKDDLKSFRPDFIYLDPARRNAAGKKVFLMEDCSPDPLALLPALFDIADEIMIKLSPMADISMVASRLGDNLDEIQAVGHEGECKELLCLLRKGHSGGWKITATDMSDSFIFLPSEEAECAADYASGPMDYIYEPGAALMKSGAFKLISRRFSVRKLDRDTQLYFSSFPDIPLGKTRKVIDVQNFSKKTIKEIALQWPEAEIATRNFPIDAETLRERSRIRHGGPIHIYACTFRGEKVLIICEQK